MAQINAFFQYIANNWQIIYNADFQKGCIAGAIALIILVIILKIIFNLMRGRQRKCNGILGKDESGEVFISAIALSDLIKSLEPQFTGVYIAKTILFKEKKSYILKLIAELNDKEASFPNLIDAIRDKILTSAKENLGIESISKIDINLRRVKG